MPLDKMLTEIQQNGKPASAQIGHYRLEVCLSDDRQFCAVQLFRFVDFKNNAVFAPRFYEGEAAEKMSQIL
jgi:hypothetical protein